MREESVDNVLLPNNWSIRALPTLLKPEAGRPTTTIQSDQSANRHRLFSPC
jgi:hypothetical protein